MRNFGMELEFPHSFFYADTNVSRDSFERKKLFREEMKKLGLSIVGQTSRAWWGIKDESGGFEITSPKMDNQSDFYRDLSILTSHLQTLERNHFQSRRRGRYYPGVYCRKHSMGHHVHIDIPEAKGSNITFKERERVLLAWHFSRYERFLYSLQPGYRKNSFWCLPVASKFKMFERGKWRGLSFGDILKLDIVKIRYLYRGLGINAKSTALSLGPLSRYGSVEIRIGATSFDLDDLYHWTLICQHAIDRTVAQVFEKEPGKNFRSLNDFLTFIGVASETRRWAHRARRRYQSWAKLKKDLHNFRYVLSG